MERSIDWDMILEEGNHREKLEGLYGSRSMEVLSEYLGVSEGALGRKFRGEGVSSRSTGPRKRHATGIRDSSNIDGKLPS